MSETTIPHLDYDTALRLLNEAAAEKGDNYIYPGLPGKDRSMPSDSCAYVHGITWKETTHGEEGQTTYGPDYDNAEPGCLIGNALHKFGVTFAQLTDNALRNTGTPAASLLYRLEQRKVLTFDVDAGELFRYAQDQQDKNETWRDAINKAISNVEDDKDPR